MVELATVWEPLHSWDRERPERMTLAPGAVRLYVGAMEVPLVAVRPPARVQPAEDRMARFRAVLARAGRELDCVETGWNYKINRSDTKESVGGIVPDALKFHVGRILAIGQLARTITSSRPPG
jgi:hypothetical protein